jgi:hypothetical protein
MVNWLSLFISSYHYERDIDSQYILCITSPEQIMLINIIFHSVLLSENFSSNVHKNNFSYVIRYRSTYELIITVLITL